MSMTPGFERKRVQIPAPEPVTSDPEKDLMLAAMRALEHREGERLGWDQDPRLYLVHLVDLHTIEVRIVPYRRWVVRQTSNPIDDIYRQANSAAYQTLTTGVTPITDRKFQDSPDGLAGVAFMFEAWSIDMDLLTEDERVRVMHGERLIKDHPARMEVRQVYAADINGNGYMVLRRRGHKTAHISIQHRDGTSTESADSSHEAFTDKVTAESLAGGPSIGGRGVTALMTLAVAARHGQWPFDPHKYPGTMVPLIPKSASGLWRNR